MRRARARCFYLTLFGVFALTVAWRCGIVWLERHAVDTLLAQYPRFPSDGGRYHTATEIETAALLDNTLNPFYTSYQFAAPAGNQTTLAYGPVDRGGQMRVALVCGQHGREFISPELCYHLIRLLQLQERHPYLTERLFWLRERGVQFWVLPLANRWAHERIEKQPGRACLRVNRNGVDLNRNFPCPDFVQARASRGAVDYGGERPLSEHESVATDQFLALAAPHILLNVHSGAQKILLPYDCTPLEMHPHYGDAVRMANLARQAMGLDGRTLPVGKSSLLLYEAHGTLMDYAAATLEVPLVYTLEIYEAADADQSVGDAELSAEQCMHWFNPEAGDDYERVIELWLRFVVALAEKSLLRMKPGDS